MENQVVVSADIIYFDSRKCYSIAEETEEELCWIENVKNNIIECLKLLLGKA